MEIKECYRVLEVEVGATRETVEAAYCRLLERWHPDRVASGKPEALSEAQRMVQVINEAYQTLVKIAPGSPKVSTPAPTAAPPAARAKPTLPPWVAAQTISARPAPPPPPPTPPTSVPPPAPPPKPPPQPTPTPAAPLVASNPPAAPKPPAQRKVDGPAAPPTSFTVLRRQAVVCYDLLFPVGNPRRRFGPLVVAGVVLLLLLVVVKCTSKSPEQIQAAKAELVARTTGRLTVKSNRPNTTIEVTQIPVAGTAAPSPHNGTADGAAEQTMAALAPGKYTLTARSEGYREITREVSVEATRTTEAAVHFKSGSLRVDSLPAGATVKFGHTVLGQTPLVVPQLPPGELSFTLEYPLWPALPFKTTITEDQETAETLRLPHGKLVVESSPPGATVLFNKHPIGQTPLTIERYQAGNTKLTLQAKDFPPLELAIAMEDRGEVKLSPMLGNGFPLLDPEALLRAVWVVDDPDKLSPPTEGINGPFQPQNGIVRNLHRKSLYEVWLRKSYRLAATVKSYDRDSGQVEFSEQRSELSKYRILARLTPGARAGKDLSALLAKGATFTFYGRLTAVEESRWPAKVISFEFSDAEPLH